LTIVEASRPARRWPPRLLFARSGAGVGASAHTCLMYVGSYVLVFLCGAEQEGATGLRSTRAVSLPAPGCVPGHQPARFKLPYSDEAHLWHLRSFPFSDSARCKDLRKRISGTYSGLEFQRDFRKEDIMKVFKVTLIPDPLAKLLPLDPSRVARSLFAGLLVKAGIWLQNGQSRRALPSSTLSAVWCASRQTFCAPPQRGSQSFAEPVTIDNRTGAWRLALSKCQSGCVGCERRLPQV
jgi:hypothetical protein